MLNGATAPQGASINPVIMHVWWGAVAQLGERLVRNEEVSGSIPLSSTKETIGIRGRPRGLGAGNSRRTFPAEFAIPTSYMPVKGIYLPINLDLSNNQ
jgi:hypothetical protein